MAGYSPSLTIFQEREGLVDSSRILSQRFHVDFSAHQRVDRSGTVALRFLESRLAQLVHFILGCVESVPRLLQLGACGEEISFAVQPADLRVALANLR